MIIFVYGKCSTCKKALQFLQQHQIPVTVKEITKEPPSILELQQMLKFHNGNLKKLFNTSGELYREMQLSQKIPDMSLEAALALLHKHGMLVKRPFLLSKDVGFTGFKETEWKNLL